MTETNTSTVTEVVVSNEQRALDLWKEHFEGLYNPPAVMLACKIVGLESKREEIFRRSWMSSDNQEKAVIREEMTAIGTQISDIWVEALRLDDEVEVTMYRGYMFPDIESSLWRFGTYGSELSEEIYSLAKQDYEDKLKAAEIEENRCWMEAIMDEDEDPREND